MTTRQDTTPAVVPTVTVHPPRLSRPGCSVMVSGSEHRPPAAFTHPEWTTAIAQRVAANLRGALADAYMMGRADERADTAAHSKADAR